MVIQTWIFGRQFFENEQSEPVISKKTTDLLPMIKFELSRKNYKFGKFLSATVNLTASQYIQTFLMKLVVAVLMNVIFRYCIIKCVNIWKLDITQ